MYDNVCCVVFVLTINMVFIIIMYLISFSGRWMYDPILCNFSVWIIRTLFQIFFYTNRNIGNHNMMLWFSTLKTYDVILLMYVSVSKWHFFPVYEINVIHSIIVRSLKTLIRTHCFQTKLSKASQSIKRNVLCKCYYGRPFYGPWTSITVNR